MVRRASNSAAPGQLSLGLIGDSRDILQLLVTGLESRDARLVPEFEVCRGRARIDLAVVGDQLDGYEIKSAHDSLARLASQTAYYSRVFDTLTLVGPPRHVDAGARMLPGWWGLAVVNRQSHRVETVRDARTNPMTDVHARVQLLWRDEVLHALVHHGRGQSRAGRRELWRDLADTVSSDELRRLVCDAIRSRSGWRSGC